MYATIKVSRGLARLRLEEAKRLLLVVRREIRSTASSLREISKGLEIVTGPKPSPSRVLGKVVVFSIASLVLSGLNPHAALAFRSASAAHTLLLAKRIRRLKLGEAIFTAYDRIMKTLESLR